MRIPTLKGTIRRRLLVNFRARPEVVQKLLPAPFQPKLHNGHAIVGICLIRLEQIRPVGIPGMLGISSENAAHRIAVQWNDNSGTLREGVFIPRRDTGSPLNRLAGGRLFPGEHHPARFDVSDIGGRIDFRMDSLDGKATVRLIAEDARSLLKSSCFETLDQASAFFEGGSLGFSATRDAGRLDGLILRTLEWPIRPLDVREIKVSYFTDLNRFPKGTIEFDHALIMRNVQHEWHKAEDLET
jgi:hypothetical protein